jgi:predicted RNase H-like HicB family nuclease
VHHEFTAIIERDGPWHIAYCAEMPGANGEGKSGEECLAKLREAIAFILDYRREESLRALHPMPRRNLSATNEAGWIPPVIFAGMAPSSPD